MSDSPRFSIVCKKCGWETLFDQPYPYHAGFTDQGFLYNDTGTLTLVWSMLDPVLEQRFPGNNFWTLNWKDRQVFEKMLLAAPDGSRWRFRNPARCTRCSAPIMKPMLHSVHYVIYPGSVLADQRGGLGLTAILKPPA
jgi:hypothetical protein